MTIRTKVHEDDFSITYEVKDDDGNVIGEDVERKPTPEDSARSTLDQRLDQALDGLRSYVALSSPTAAQTTAAVKLLSRVAIALIRLWRNRLDGTD